MWQKLRTFFTTDSNLRTIVFHALIIVGFLTTLFSCVKVCDGLARPYADRWEKQLSSISCYGDGDSALPLSSPRSGAGLQSAHSKSSDDAIETLPDEQRGRLRGQYQEIRARMEHHLSVLKLFYVTSYTTILMTGGLTAVAAIMLLFITMDGWKSSNQYARNLFLMATATATFCAAFPSLFQQQRNIDENTRLYLEYVALTNEMCSYATTGSTNDDPALTANDFIVSVDKRLKVLNKIAVGFDVSKVPDFTAALQRASNPNQTVTSPASKSASKPSSQRNKP
jgi:hypothetical protein